MLIVGECGGDIELPAALDRDLQAAVASPGELGSARCSMVRGPSAGQAVGRSTR